MTTSTHLDCHMHSTYSDGSSSIDRMAASAIEKGLTTIAITDHMPLPFPTRYAMTADRLDFYRKDIYRTQKKYSSDLTILAGLEMEYLPNRRDWIKQIVDMGWDILLVSIHGIESGPGNGNQGHFMVNGRKKEFQNTLKTVFRNDIQALCTRYYNLIREAANTQWFDVIGHMDVIKKHNLGNQYFDENSEWYRALIQETLTTIADNKMKMEINTNGRNHPAGTFYPSEWIIRDARAKGIPIILGSDAHAPDYQGQYFSRAGSSSG